MDETVEYLLLLRNSKLYLSKTQKYSGELSYLFYALLLYPIPRIPLLVLLSQEFQYFKSRVVRLNIFFSQDFPESLVGLKLSLSF